MNKQQRRYKTLDGKLAPVLMLADTQGDGTVAREFEGADLLPGCMAESAFLANACLVEANLNSSNLTEA